MVNDYGGLCTNCEEQEGGMRGELCPGCGRCNDCVSNFPGRHANSCRLVPAVKKSKIFGSRIKGPQLKGGDPMK